MGQVCLLSIRLFGLEFGHVRRGSDKNGTERKRMSTSFLKPYVNRLAERSLQDGGFADRPGGTYRPDATAWAILILQNYDPQSSFIEPAQTRLTEDQLEDGRVCVSPNHPEALWPTPMAILAWNNAPSFQDHQTRALDFLLNVAGSDGWPWTADTHTWVQPTAMSMIAIKVAEADDQTRTQLAKHMLMNRQLPHGGWNYGSTMVFGQELRPFPETTGAALNALSGRVPSRLIKASLNYLVREISRLHTPIALGWGLLGLGAWGLRPPEWPDLVQSCLERESRYGEYDTASLCLLLSTMFAPKGLDSLSTFSNAVTTTA